MNQPASAPAALRSLSVIARDIRREWKPKVNFGVVPYLDALLTMETASEKYGEDDGESIVLYFLSNASTFRGPRAKELKAELKAHAVRQLGSCRHGSSRQLGGSTAFPRGSRR